MVYAFVAVIVIAIAAGVIYTAKRNSEIKRSGIETDAVVTRVREDVSTDSEGLGETVTYIYYVTYRTTDGQTVEAQLTSGKSLDVRVGGKVWDRDLHEGSSVRIKYLPEKPKYVIRVD